MELDLCKPRLNVLETVRKVIECAGSDEARRSTADVSQDYQRNAGPNNFTERRLEVFVNSDTYGRLLLGQGDTSSNNSSEVDLSGTVVVAYSNVADFAGGIQCQEDGDLSGVSIGDTFDNRSWRQGG